LIRLIALPAAAPHAFEHDAGPLPGKGFSTCITASQLVAASLDCQPTDERLPGRAAFEKFTEPGYASAGTRTVRMPLVPQCYNFFTAAQLKAVS
jgi:hypothetical protein